MSVPQFGGWDHKANDGTNYSMVFEQARANRKRHKSDLTRHSFANERELLTRRHYDGRPVLKKQQKKIKKASMMKIKKSILRYFSCCMRS